MAQNQTKGVVKKIGHDCIDLGRIRFFQYQLIKNACISLPSCQRRLHRTPRTSRPSAKRRHQTGERHTHRYFSPNYQTSHDSKSALSCFIVLSGGTTCLQSFAHACKRRERSLYEPRPGLRAHRQRDTKTKVEVTSSTKYLLTTIERTELSHLC